MINQAKPEPQRTSPMMGAFLAGLAGLSCCASSNGVAQAMTEEGIRVTPVPVDGSFRVTDDPMAAVWARVPEQTVQLNRAPPVHQSILLLHEAAGDRDTPVLLKVSAVSDRQKIYFRLRWKDATRDDTRRMGTYSDGAAIQLPSTKEPTSPMMGLPDAPVEIWRWSASTNAAEALAAGGPGTLARQQDVSLHGQGIYRDEFDAQQKEWVVVFSHDLRAADGTSSPFLQGSSVPVAFAIWQGSEAQRGGYKRVSGWVTLGMDAAR